MPSVSIISKIDLIRCSIIGCFLTQIYILVRQFTQINCAALYLCPGRWLYSPEGPVLVFLNDSISILLKA